MPRNEAREQLANLLSDKSKDVRRDAILNIQRLCTLNDKAWLSRHLESETSADNRELMEEKTNQLKPAGALEDE